MNVGSSSSAAAHHGVGQSPSNSGCATVTTETCVCKVGTSLK